MVSEDLLFHLFRTFDPLPHGPESARIKKLSFKQGSLPYKMEISFQGGKVLLDIF